MSLARIVIYGSTVAGSMKVKAEQARITHILEAHKIDFDFVDISLPEHENDKTYMRNKSGKNDIPQVFVDGEYKGDCEMLSDINEGGREELIQWLLPSNE